ncbi:hypothetical protein LJB75_00240 [Bacteroidales bacterium OttesenSCG-928-L19]|nr:hypothetical protein [Bacteroidales bacterium OttesenSCG-928-L19]
MKKLLFTTVLIFLTVAAFAQPKKIQYRAEWSIHDEDVLPGITKLVGSVVFTQDEVVGYCDSAYLHENENILEAFGKKVIIHINDSVTLYGKYVKYNGDTKIASISKDVILEDPTSVLYTDSLIYDLNADLAYYITGGKIINKENTLTSIIGNYYTKTNWAYLYHDVHVVNESYTMDCDSLSINTETEIVYFLSRTHLISDENEIFTTSGWYDTQQDLALLVEDVEIYSEAQQITGDSLYYDKNMRFGIGWNNVVVTDTAEGYILMGDYLEHYENGGISLATKSPVLILLDKMDSLFVHADTFHIHIDTLQEVQLIVGFNHVKFFREDMQGACDSIVYLMKDSVLTMFFNPVIWAEEYQLSADTIYFFILDEDNTKIHLARSGFIVSSLYEDSEFNQVKGLNIYGHIYKKELQQVDVIGNAECLYYIQEDDKSLIGINYSETSEMRILFKEKEISGIVLYNDPDGKIYPDSQLEENERILRDFRWLIEYRPASVEDIFHTPIPRIKAATEEKRGE